MSFDILNATKTITHKYTRYLKTMFDIDDAEYRKLFEKEISSIGSFAKGPYLDVVDSFESGLSVRDLISNGLLSEDFKYIDDIYPKILYKHQEESISKLKQGRNVVVSTGTGSGKTESFLIPILDSLMQEKSEFGKITPGVRALLIYPMNALANDQIARLRRSLKNYPDITFGSYTGQTEEKYRNALEKYKALNDGGTPLPNELISREQMKETPPNILITNYSMLEYLMLRPKDNTLFQGEYANNWHYIVLDEAHTYSGSTGIEVSMLLRRLASYLDKTKLQYILTSATLGDKNTNDEVVEFAKNLCDANFHSEDVIRASRIKLIKDDEKAFDLSVNDYKELDDILESGYADERICEMLSNYLKVVVKKPDYSEFLYEYLINDNTYWRVKEFLIVPKSVKDICGYFNWTDDELGNFVNVASKAIKNGKKLFDSRYHMFLRATDGVYITLGNKNVSLSRKNKEYINGVEYQYFEIVTCKQCHAIYLIGTIKEDHLIQKSNYSSDNITSAFLLGDKISDEDEDDSLEDEKLEVKNYELCPHCGFIREANQVHKNKCIHSESEYIKLVRVKQSERTGRVTKCIKCEAINNIGILRHFFSGQEASTSVIGTALFEELPNKKKEIQTHYSADGFDDGFDDGFGEKTTQNVVSKAKQFIAFSDNRQTAAFFATYFYETYQGFLYSKVIRDNIKQIDGSSKTLSSFVNDMSYDFKENKLSDMYDISPVYDKEAWKAMMRELVAIKARNSLSGLGLMALDLNDDVKIVANSKYNLTADDVKNICLIIIESMLSENAIYHRQKFSEMDVAFYSNNNVENSYVLSNPKDRYTKSFVPKSDSSINKRYELLDKVLKAKNMQVGREDIIKLLEAFWNHFFVGQGLMKDNTQFNGKRFDIYKLKILKNAKWYRCKKCNRLTPYNIENLCPIYKCDGKLEEVNVDELEKDNHYYRIYNDLSIQPLRVAEHTAQLSSEEAYNLQEKFKKQQIDVLSCSTTFEMGVDIGDLETVFMRNMPPTPSNYAQRAGRAGRSVKSAALALTFCNKSNHDFNFFNDPVSMIKGVITPPIFKVENEKIGIRHLYSAALSFFWKKYPEFFKNICDFFNYEADDYCGYNLFKTYLESKPDDLKEFLLKAFPAGLASKFEIKSFGWVKWLFGENDSSYPCLRDVYEEYKREVDILYKEKERLESSGKSNAAILYRINTYTKENVIAFLSRNNILPKYGFPVDTVELDVVSDKTSNQSLGIDLSRDLAVAISEYAPGCDVVAAGNLITSRYIKKMPSKAWKEYDFVKCSYCQTLNIDIHRESIDGVSLKECRQCKEKFDRHMIKTFIIPEFGFVSDHKISKPSLIKPDKTYRTEASIVSYGDVIKNAKMTINGKEIEITSIENGEIAILNSSSFFVCETCGCAYSEQETNLFGSTYTHRHKSVYGYECKNQKMINRNLGYRFKTDAIIIDINTPMEYEEAYSVLQALILSIAQSLNIDNSEIAGCLQFEPILAGKSYQFVLYDTTPGGAGHVRRVANKISLAKILQNAYYKAANCNCGGEEKDSSCYNCLRTYQNQKHHDIIKRSYVIDNLDCFK